MHAILEKRLIAPNEYDMWVEAPKVASHARPGQFVVVRPTPKGERIPLTIADYDLKRGSIRFIFQAVGKTTHQMARFEVGDSLSDVLGPLGRPSEIKKWGTVMLVGGGVGIAALFPILRELKRVGNYTITVLGGRSSELVIMKDECRRYSDELIITTDDGSEGIKGVVTEGMRVASEGRKIDQAWAIGPTIMMKFASIAAKEMGIPIWVSLNPIMVDGTGMCGGCRVEVGGEVRFACVDGPEFDGWAVNWDVLMRRLQQYKEEEKLSLEQYMAEVESVV